MMILSKKMKVTPTTLLMALSSVSILKEGKTGKKPPGLTKRYKKNVKTRVWSGGKKKLILSALLIVFFVHVTNIQSASQRHTHISKRRNQSRRRKKTDDDVPRKQILRYSLKSVYFWKKLICSFVLLCILINSWLQH